MFIYLKVMLTSLLLVLALALKATEVTTETPDEELLDGIDKSELYKVADPSTRLYMSIEGIDQDIRIRFEDDIIFIYSDVDWQERDKLIAAFNKATGNKNEVKVIANPKDFRAE